MNWEKSLNIEKLKEITTIANSATFLYRTFTQNQSVLELAFSFSDQELIDMFYRKINEERNLENVSVVYALIIALSFHNTSYSSGFFRNLQENHIVKWAEELSDIYFNKVSFDTYDKVTELTYSIIEDNEIQDEDTVEINL